MDDRTLEVIIKAQNETKAAFAELSAQMAALTAATAASGAAAAAANVAFFGMGAFGLLPLIGAIGITVVALWPLIFALGAIIANVIAMTTLFTVAVGSIGALSAAFFLLGAANAGGLSPATEMVKAHHALDTAIKEHTEALKELKQVQAGVDIFNLGPGGQAESLRIAQAYVTATTRNVQDAQHDIREPVSGLGGPIDRLGSGIDDLRHHLEQVSRPFADHIAMWALQFLPAIQAAGDALAKWFGDRLPAFLNFTTPLVHDLADMFKGIGTQIGNVIDFVLRNPKTFQDFFKDITTAIPKILGDIFQWLINIHTWFDANWPSIEKKVNEFFVTWQGLGDAISFIKDNLPLLSTAFVVAGGIILAAGLSANAPWLALEAALLSIIVSLKWINSNPAHLPAVTGDSIKVGGPHWVQPTAGGGPMADFLKLLGIH